jgi:hypothetical protein
MTDTAAMDVEEDDPVVAEYDVYITPEAEEQQLYVLQYLNRPPDQPFTKATQSKPTELRVKKESGFVEVDVPIDIHQNYNRPAGVRWGESMRKTKGFGQKAFGIASGFERTMPRTTNRPGAVDGTSSAPTAVEDDDNFEEYVTHFEDANEKGHVLNSQTFGGQILKDDGKGPSYMLGTFRDGMLRRYSLKSCANEFRPITPYEIERPGPAPNAIPPYRCIRPTGCRQSSSRQRVSRRCQSSRAQGLPSYCQEEWWGHLSRADTGLHEIDEPGDVA